MQDADDDAATMWLRVGEATQPVSLVDVLDLREDRYEAKRVLGTGGMGEVALSRDRRIGRDVALKVVKTDVASPAARRAFIVEARVQAQLEHPAIIPVYDIGIDDSGREFFTMRAIAGTTLAKVLSRLRASDAAAHRDYTLHRLLDVFRHICLAVEYAHTRGVIHRDLKPANIMLGEFGEVYVLDWGLAQSKATAEDPSSPVFGTPGYIAPEQTFLGTQIDARADVYALGAILFEILSLQRLHTGRSSQEILDSTRRADGAHPRHRAIDREIPPELDATCARATSFSPDARHASVRELLAEIEAYQEGQRNQSLRNELAATHAETAREEALLALGAAENSEGHRRRALQEIARALALDPDNDIARRTLVKLIAEPPRELPAEVAAEIARGEQDEGVFAFRLGAISYALFAVIALITLFQGLRSWTGLAVVIASVGAAALWCIRLTRTFRPSESVYVFLLASIAISTASGFYGPLILVPVLAAANATAFNLAIVRAQRARIIVLGCLVFLVPALLEWAGVIDPFYAFEAGALVVRPRFIEFDETMVRLALVLVNLAAIIIPSIVVWKIADTKDELRRKYVLQGWQLRQLVAD